MQPQYLTESQIIERICWWKGKMVTQNTINREDSRNMLETQQQKEKKKRYIDVFYNAKMGYKTKHKITS